MKKIIMMAPLLALAGCFTLKQTEIPGVQMSRAPEGRDIKVSVTGFAATVTSYIPVYSYQTVYVDHGPRYYGHHRGWYGGGHYQTMTTETMVPQVQATDVYLRRAQQLMEDSGFLLRAPSPDFTVEVTFEGPFVRDDERAVEFAWMFLSVLSAEYSTQTWTAKLRIHDAKSGKVLLSQDYAQKYEDCVWSPLFFIGLAGCTENTPNFMQNWCLGVLTDRVTADATAFMAKANYTAPVVVKPAAPVVVKPAAPAAK